MTTAAAAGARAHVLAALEGGHEVTPEAAASFPDIVLVRDEGAVPAWLLSLIRRPVAPGAPRYVVANDRPYHVSRTGQGALVAEVEFFDRNGVQKPVHNLYAIDAAAKQAAVAAYDRVCSFVREPMAFATWLRGDRAGDPPVLTTVVAVRESPVAARLAREAADAAALPRAVPNAAAHLQAVPTASRPATEPEVRIVRRPARRVSA